MPEKYKSLKERSLEWADELLGSDTPAAEAVRWIAGPVGTPEDVMGDMPMGVPSMAIIPTAKNLPRFTKMFDAVYDKLLADNPQLNKRIVNALSYMYTRHPDLMSKVDIDITKQASGITRSGSFGTEIHGLIPSAGKTGVLEIVDKDVEPIPAYVQTIGHELGHLINAKRYPKSWKYYNTYGARSTKGQVPELEAIGEAAERTTVKDIQRFGALIDDAASATYNPKRRYLYPGQKLWDAMKDLF